MHSFWYEKKDGGDGDKGKSKTNNYLRGEGGGQTSRRDKTGALKRGEKFVRCRLLNKGRTTGGRPMKQKRKIYCM